jgi:hypothetical protein
VVPLTLAAGGIALVLFGLEIRAALPDRIMAASFMTLSILTVPHMLVPLIVAVLAGRERRIASRGTAALHWPIESARRAP